MCALGGKIDQRRWRWWWCSGIIRNQIKKREQGLNVARKFLCMAAQGNIDLTCNYWKGTREERGERREENEAGLVKMWRVADSQGQ